MKNIIELTRIFVLLAVVLFTFTVCEQEAKPIIYTVTFHSNGGIFYSNEGTDVFSITVEQGKKIPEPQFIQSKGYNLSFEGWDKEAEVINILDLSIWDFASDTVTEDINLYARWRNVTLTCELGEEGPGGGIIFYRSEEGFTVQGYNSSGNNNKSNDYTTYTAYYLEVAPNAFDSGAFPAASFLNSNTSVSGTSANIGRGRNNTRQILYNQLSSTTANCAAMVCDTYKNNGKDDWFLPSFDELKEYGNFYKNYLHGSWLVGNYWTSTQHLTAYSYLIIFNGIYEGRWTVDSKINANKFFPIRAF